MADLSKGCKWFFAESPLNQDVGPNDPKFEIFKPDINSLVRESIQNSMDAVKDVSIPVRISYRIGRFQRHTFPSFFDLADHIGGCLEYWKSAAEDVFRPIHNAFSHLYDKQLYYLEVSDANTTGMNYEKGDNKTAFHGFLHSTGASNEKKANSGGAFGIGKAAYYAMSPIRSIIVSSQTEDANHVPHYVFQGVAQLCTHQTKDGILRTPIGFYSTNDANPVTNIDEIPEIFRRREIGTSINVLGIEIRSLEDKKNIYEEIKLAVLRNFWLAIYNNRLEVMIGDGITGTETISSSNIVSLIEESFQDLADDGRKGNINPRPYLELVRNAKPGDKKYILINENLQHLGAVRLYIFRHPKGRGRIQYFRMPNMMVKREKLRSANNFFAVFICDNPEGDELLKKMESVAHDNWAAENWKPRGVDGKVSLTAKAIEEELETFIRNGVDAAFGVNNQEVMEIVGLDRYLYIPTASENDFMMSDSEALMSEPTGDFKKEGHSPTTIMTGQPVVEESKKENMLSKGKVYIGNIAKAAVSNEGSLFSGRGHRRIHKSNGTHIIPGVVRTNSSDEEGIEGSFLREVNVEYRGIAQKENGQYYHYLLITSFEDVENGRIVIETGREYGKPEALNIVETELGIPCKNMILNLHLKKGLNRIRIRFADNMSHTILLEAYEDK